jgi:hypothetical protein
MYNSVKSLHVSYLTRSWFVASKRMNANNDFGGNSQREPDPPPPSLSSPSGSILSTSATSVEDNFLLSEGHRKDLFDDDYDSVGCCFFSSRSQRRSRNGSRSQECDDRTRGFLYWCVTILAL